jgi:hypothetical protein
MAGQAELKILISVANETAGALQQIQNDLKSVLAALTSSDLGSAAAQFVTAAKEANNLATDTKAVGAAMKELNATAATAGKGTATAFGELDDATRALITDVGTASKALADLAKNANEAGQGGGLRKPGDDARKSKEGVDVLIGSVEGLTKALKFAAGGFLAFEAISFLKDLADTAARTQVLATVLDTVGKNAGYTSQQITAADKEVQKMGITAAASRESLAQLISAGLNINLAAPLARASQDLAVIAGWNSSETFSRLITNINQMDTVGLRWMGIVIDRQSAIQHATEVVGHALDANQQKQAFANAVLAQAVTIQGTYEASMGDVGKQLTSLPRYIETLKNSLGQELLPVYSELVKGAIDILSSLNDLAASFQTTGKNADLFGTAADRTDQSFRGLADAIHQTSALIVQAIQWFKDHKDVLVETGTVLRDVAIAYAGLTIISKITSLLPLFVEGISGAVTVLKALRTGAIVTEVAMGALAGPIGLIVTALTALGAVALGAWLSSSDGADKTAKSTGDVQKAIDTLKQKYTDLAAQQKQNLDLARQISDKNLIANDEKATPQARSSAASDVLTLKQQQADLQKQIKDTNASIKEQRDSLMNADLSDAQRKQIQVILDGSAAQTKAMVEASKAWQNFAEAAQAAGIDVSQATTGIAQKFSEAADVIVSAQAFVKDGSAQSKTLLNAMLLEFEKLADTVSSPEELKKFQAAGEALKAMAQTAGVDITSSLNGAMGQAKQHEKEAQAALKAGGESALNEGRAIAKARAQAIVEAAQNTAALTKIANQAALDADQYGYQQGLVNLDTYYNKRAEVIKANAAQEVAVANAQIKALQIDKGAAKTGSERVGIDNQIQAQRDHIKQINAQAAADESREAIARAQEQEALDKEVANVKFQAMQETDQKLAGSQAALAQQYEDLHKKLDSVKGAKELLDAEYARKADVLAMQQLNDATTRQGNLQATLLENARAQVALANSRGALTDISAANADNALITAEIENVRKLMAVEQEQAEQYKALGMEKEYDDARTKAASYQNQILQLASAYHTLGDSIRTNFSEALTQGIYDVMSHSKSIGEAFRGAALSFVNSINQVIAKDLSQKITSWIVDQTGGEGNSIFDKLAEGLGGKSGRQLGEDASNAMWVRSADATKQTFTTNGSTQGGPGLMGAVNTLMGNFGKRGGAAMGLGSLFNMGNTASNDYGFDAGGGNLDSSTSTGGSALFGLGGGDGFSTFQSSLETGLNTTFTDLGNTASNGGFGIDSMGNALTTGLSGVLGQTQDSLGGMFDSINSMFSDGGAGGGGGMAGSMGGMAGGAIGGAIGGKQGAQWGQMIGQMAMMAMMMLADGGLPSQGRRGVVPVRKFADGFGMDDFKRLNHGLISGPGTGRSDSIPAMVANNEFIVNEKATKEHLPLLYALNSGQTGSIRNRMSSSINKFADGGMPSGLQSIAKGTDAGGGAPKGGKGDGGSRFVLVDERKRVPQAMSGSDGKDIVFMHLQRDVPTLKTMLGIK